MDREILRAAIIAELDAINLYEQLASITGDGAVYLRLERSGQSYTASYSLDSGQTYSTPKSNTFTASLPEELYVGLVVNSGSNSASATAGPPSPPG